MVKYRLTKKGKVIIVLLCSFMVLSITLGVSISKDKAIANDNNKLATVQNKPISRPQPNASDQAQKERVVLKDEVLDKLKTSIFFDANATSLSNENDKGLEDFIAAAIQYEDTKIHIEGNCATTFDNYKSKEQKAANYNISLLRAKTIADYLKDKGINPDRLVIIANGSDKPLKDNDTPAGRKYNRRVDVFLVNK